MRKWTMFAVAAAVACMVFAGCGEKPKPAPAGGTAEGKPVPAVEVTPAPAAETKSATPAPEAKAESPAVLKVATAPAEAGTRLLFDFETDDDVSAWKVEDAVSQCVELSVSDEHATSGRRSLKMVLKPHEWPGMHTLKIPADWSGNQDLKFDVFADQASELSVRIDDTNSSGYSTRFNSEANSVGKGQNTVAIPLSSVAENIDLKKVKSMYIYSTGVEGTLVFYIDNIRLVKKAQ